MDSNIPLTLFNLLLTLKDNYFRTTGKMGGEGRLFFTSPRTQADVYISTSIKGLFCVRLMAVLLIISCKSCIVEIPNYFDTLLSLSLFN